MPRLKFPLPCGLTILNKRFSGMPSGAAQGPGAERQLCGAAEAAQAGC